MRAIIAREFLALWRTPAGWLLAAASQLVLAWWFLRLTDRYRRDYQPALTRMDSALGSGDLIIAPWAGGLPTLTLLLTIAAALGVRIMADDRRHGGLTLALAGSQSTAGIVFGKYVGGLGYLTILITLWLTLPASLALGTGIDLRTLGASALGLWFTGAGLLSLSLALAAMVESPASAAVLAFGAGLLLMLIRAGESPGMLGWWGLSAHLANFLEGSVHLADIAYFVSLAGISLLVTTARLLQLREGT